MAQTFYQQAACKNRFEKRKRERMSQAIKTHDRDKWNDCSFALHRRCINCLAIVGRAFLSLFSLLSPLPWFPLFSSNSRVIETHGFCRFWFASTLLNSSGNESLRTVLFFLNDRQRKWAPSCVLAREWPLLHPAATIKPILVTTATTRWYRSDAEAEELDVSRYKTVFS